MHDDAKNYYEVLEIPMDATPEEIHSAYKRAKNVYAEESLALYSLMTSHDCKSILNTVEEAYSILSVPNKKREYDRIRGYNQTHLENPPQLESIELTQVVQEQVEQKQAVNDNSIVSHLQIKEHIQREQHQSNMPTHNHEIGREREFNIARKNEVEVPKITALKRFSLTYDKDEEFEQEIENVTTFTGSFLKKIREYKNVDIVRMADMTKVSKTYIRYIENDEYEKLPALAYVRGFVYQYAKCLKLSPDLVATSYLRHIKSLKDGSTT